MLGKHGGAPLIVRQHTSGLRTALLIAGVLIGVLALYVTYELGRYNAGYDRQAVAQQRAELDTFRVGRSREQAEVARTMGDLQAQVARQSQELAFYRGVVAQGAASVGVKIEQLRITAGAHPASYVVHMSLVRSGRADTPVTGNVQMSLDGTAAQGARTLDLATLTAGRQRELRYNFRYLESFDQELSLPPSFKPERLNVEVSSGRRDVAPLSQTFLWNVEAAP